MRKGCAEGERGRIRDMRTASKEFLERVANWPDEDIEKLDQALRQIEEWRTQERAQ